MMCILHKFKLELQVDVLKYKKKWLKNTKIEAINFSLEQSNRLPHTPHNTYFHGFDLKISIATTTQVGNNKEQ